MSLTHIPSPFKRVDTPSQQLQTPIYLGASSIIKHTRNLLAGFLGMTMNLLGFVDNAKDKIIPGQIMPLCFHNPQIKLFERVILWLKHNDFHFISTDQLLEILQSGTVPSEKMVWITVDDGWRDNIRNVLPLLIEYNIPATFFISTAPVESSDGQFWFSFARKNRSFLPHPYSTQVEELWNLNEYKRREIIASAKRRRLDPGKREALTIGELQAVAQLPNISVGVHTDNHPLTAHCTEIELEQEIVSSKRKLETWLGRGMYYFSYPRGVACGRERKILRQQDFILAVTLEPALMSLESCKTIDVFRIPRIAIPDTGYFTEIECHLVGIWQPFMFFNKKILRVINKC